MEISGSTQTTLTGSSVTADARPVISSDFETFLQMLSTQLQNQDPLNPVDSADYAVQLATFSSVEQQVLTNNLLEDLVGRMQLSGMGELAGWVGLDALSEAGAYYDGAPVTVTPDPPSEADTAVLVIRDSYGSVVQRADVSLQAEPYQWDGTTITGQIAPYGSYTFELESSADGELISIDPVASYAEVVEARRDGGDTMLMLRGGGMVPAADVIGLRQ